MDPLLDSDWPYNRPPIPMFQTDAAGKLLHVNKHVLALLHLTAEGMRGQDLTKFMTEPARLLHEKHLASSALSICDIESQFVAADGRVIDVLLCFSKEMDDSGELTGLLGAMMDLTARRVAEREAGQMAALLGSVITHANDAILITEAEPVDFPGPRILYANPAFSQMTGYSAAELVGKTPRIVQGLKSNRQELDRFKRALKAWEPIRVELVNYAKDGREFIVEIDAAPVFDGEGHCTHWVAVQRNITNRRKQDEALRHSQKMEVIGQLTGGVAHDFNNVLTSILGGLDTIKRGMGPNPIELNRAADMAIRGAERAAGLTHRLLSYSRQQALSPRAVDVGRLVTTMRDMLVRTLGESYHVETLVQPGLWRARIDPNQMESALLNLAINARDAMPAGGTLTIETANVTLGESYAKENADVAAGQYVGLTVTDTGSGMSKSVLERAFDPFFTTKGIGQGTGLGLSQVYGFVKQSEGHVKLYSQIGAGTIVRLYLPRLSGPALSGEDAGHALRATRAKQQTKILVVEDDEEVRRYSTDVLRELGYGVVEAGDASRALTMLQQQPDVRLLFTDIGLPGGMTGAELAEEALRRHPGLCVLFTTGYAPTTLARPLDPAIPLIAKPYRYVGLAEKIAATLDGVNEAEAEYVSGLAL